MIASKDMEIHSNMLTFHMMILVIQDFVAWVGRVLLIIVGEFMTYVYGSKYRGYIGKVSSRIKQNNIIVLIHTAHLASQKNVPKDIAATEGYHVMSKI